MDKLLYSIRELFFSSDFGKKKFLIPSYQRGFKWDSNDIKRLLDDIYEFNPNEELDLFYCLQNITLIEKDGQYNVVDGQQRLTTIIVILFYLEEYDIIRDKLLYEIRNETKSFISDFIYTNSNINQYRDWDSFIKEYKDQFDFQDIYYIFSAYKTITEWFEDHINFKEDMHTKLLNNVKLIVNLPKNIEEQELFENLNGKRVPLDGADLIRALIITRVARKNVENIVDPIKYDVLINERRIRLGMTLDKINIWWSDPECKTYFNHFAKECKIISGSSVNFDVNNHPINYLYRLFALIHNEGKLDMDFYEKMSTDESFLKNLFELQRILEDWYKDKVLYHLILFVYIHIDEDAENKKITFLSIKNKWDTCTKGDFIKYLKSAISNNKIFVELTKQYNFTDEKLREIAFAENYYDNEGLIEISVLLDIIELLNTPRENLKIPAKYFESYKEDREHIFPQTPIGNKIKDERKQTQILNKYIEIFNEKLPDDKIIVDESSIDWSDETWKNRMKERINKKIRRVIPINSIGNMCLLHESVNRGYGNDFFLEKRIDIMRKSQRFIDENGKVNNGYYIRPHVYDAFNKVFLERNNELIDISNMTKWDVKDILMRKRYIIIQVSKFLNPLT